jgi:hypothetical protein
MTTSPTFAGSQSMARRLSETERLILRPRRSASSASKPVSTTISRPPGPRSSHTK